MTRGEKKLTSYLTDNRLLDDLTETAKKMGVTCWLVGGALRDVLLGRAVTDVDLATTSDPTQLACEWARKQNAHWFWLDKERQQSRVLLRYGKLEFHFDFAPLRADTLNQDLALRDFTINAFALPLLSPLSEQKLYDPLHGRKDLRDLCLRDCSERSLADDPVRILKGIRHCVTYDLQIADKTEDRMRKFSVKLSSSAAERKRNELGRVFSNRQFESGLMLLDRCQVLPCLFGNPSPIFSMQKAIADLVAFDASLSKLTANPALSEFLGKTYDETINRRTLYLFALFLKHYCPEQPETILTEQLRFSRRASMIIQKLATLDFTLMEQFQHLPDKPRSRCLWLESLGATAMDQLLFYTTVERPKFLFFSKAQQIFEIYSSSLVHNRIPDLLSGKDIKRLLPEIEDRKIGHCQKMIKEAEITGKITSRKDAKEMIVAENSIDKN